MTEELAKAGPGTPAFSLHNDVVAPYLTSLATPAQRQRWLPGFASGDLIGAIAMTEPGAGSDLAGMRTRAVRDGDTWVLSGAKTFISAGINSDLVIVLARTSPDPGAGHRAFSLLVVERGMPGFTRGRNLEKIGLKSQDTAELFFEQVPVPAANVLGEVGRGFYHLMHNLPAERMTIAISAVAAARAVFSETLEYAKNRTAFGRPIGTFQHNRFVFAELDTELDIAQVFVDRCVEAMVAGELTAAEAAKAKWWTTELQQAGGRRLRPDARRLRLHDGVPGGPRLPGRARPDHLRRHDGGHEGDRRPQPRHLSARSQSVCPQGANACRRHRRTSRIW